MGGRSTEVVQSCANPPRPIGPVPTPTGSSRTKHNRSAAIRKVDAAQDAGGSERSEGQAKWDEGYAFGKLTGRKRTPSQESEPNARYTGQWGKGVR